MHRAPFPPVGGAPRASRAPPPFTLPSRKREGGAAGADGHIAGAGAKWASPAAAAAPPGRPPAAYAAVTAGATGASPPGVAGTPQAPLDLGRRSHPPPPGGYARAAGGGGSGIVGPAARARSVTRTVAQPVSSSSAPADEDDWAEEGDAAAAAAAEVPAPAQPNVVLPASSRPLPAHHMSQDARPDRSTFGRASPRPPPSSRDREQEDLEAARQAGFVAARRRAGDVEQERSVAATEVARGDGRSDGGSGAGAGAQAMLPQTVEAPLAVPAPVLAPASGLVLTHSAPKTLLRRTRPEQREAHNAHLAQNMQHAQKTQHMPQSYGIPTSALAAQAPQAAQVAPAAPDASASQIGAAEQSAQPAHAGFVTGKAPRRPSRAKKERQPKKPGREVARSIVNTCIQKAINNGLPPATSPQGVVSADAPHVPLRGGKPQAAKQGGASGGLAVVPGIDGKTGRKRNGRPVRGKRERRSLNEDGQPLAPGSTRHAFSSAGSTHANGANMVNKRSGDGANRVAGGSAEASAWESSSLPVQPTSFADISRAFSNHPTTIPLAGAPLVPSVPAVPVPVTGMKSPWAPSQAYQSGDAWSGTPEAAASQAGIAGQPQPVSSNPWAARSQHNTQGVWGSPGDAALLNAEAARNSWTPDPTPSAPSVNSASWTTTSAENAPGAESAGSACKGTKRSVHIPTKEDGRSASRRGRQNGPRRKHGAKAEAAVAGKRGDAASHGSARPKEAQTEGAASQDAVSRAPIESAGVLDSETNGRNSAKQSNVPSRGGRGRGKRRGRGRGGGAAGSGRGGSNASQLAAEVPSAE